MLTIDGDLELASGNLLLEVGGTALDEYDRLIVTKSAVLAGTIEVRFIDGFVPIAGQSF